MKLQKNRGNSHTLQFDNKSICFSYDCPVAFKNDEYAIARGDVWGPTTRKHQNIFLQGIKTEYVSDDLFEKKLSQFVA